MKKGHFLKILNFLKISWVSDPPLTASNQTLSEERNLTKGRGASN